MNTVGSRWNKTAHESSHNAYEKVCYSSEHPSARLQEVMVRHTSQFNWWPQCRLHMTSYDVLLKSFESPESRGKAVGFMQNRLTL